MRATIVVSAVISAGVCAAYMVPAMKQRLGAGVLRLAVLTAALVVAIVWAPAWNREIITSGPYFYGDEVLGVLQGSRNGRRHRSGIRTGRLP
jgi:hypothetical protein